VTVLIATDAVELYEPGAADDTGWREPPEGAKPYWSGGGSLQPTAGITDQTGAERGGHGPHAPAAINSAMLFLPLGASPREGHTARIRGRDWVLSQVRLVTDPLGAGALDCWLATATGRP
jgi:hypothetical protein